MRPIMHAPPAGIFPTDDATTLAAKLTADDTEGWTYTVDPIADGKAHILIHDDEGFTVGHL